MRRGWTTTKLEDACEVEYGTRVVQKRDGGSTFPVYGGGGATFFMDKSNRKDCLVVARFAMSEQCTRFIEGEFFLNDSGLTVKSKNTKEILQEFLDLQFFYLNNYIYSLARGAAQKNLNIPAFKNIKIHYPSSLAEQQRIVVILDEAFAATAKAKANAEQNLKNAKELFESCLQEVFENKGEDWAEGELIDLCEITHGFAFKGKEFAVDLDEEKSIVITPGNFTEDGSLNFTGNNTKRFTGSPPDGYLFNRGDLVIVMTDLSSRMKILGKPAFIDRDNILHNQRIGRLIFKNNSFDARFLYYFFMTKGFLENIKGTATGTMVRHTAPKRILSNLISYPKEISKQQNVVQKLDALLVETKKLEAIYLEKINNLEELKKSILKKAFNGELNTSRAVAA